MMNAASIVDQSTLSQRANGIGAILQVGEKVRLTSPSGSDLDFSIKNRKPRVNDGIVDEQDLMNEVLEASLPAGSVQTTVVEDSANGRVVFDVPTPWAGRTIRSLTWVFANGKLTSFEGDTNAMTLRKHWETASGDKNRISVLAIGVNPKAKLGYTVNEIVQGAVSIAIGGNEDLGGNNKHGFFYSGTVGTATLKVDDKTLVEQGKLMI
jgi:aminopeptidase